jgi:hypothetical protein
MTENPLVPYIERYGAHQGGLGVILFVWEQMLVDLPPDHEGKYPSLDKWQLDALFAFGEGERGISIAACHGPGKTAVAAWCIVYSLLFRHPLRAVATAPSRGQLEGALMSEISKWIDKLPDFASALLEVKSMSVTLRAKPKAVYFEARTARPENPEALQGIHEDEGFVFLLVDEASGVHERIFESAGGSMSGHNCQTMLLSNPTRTSGFFFNTHHKEADRWHTIRISHEDSVRVTDSFVDEMALRYGRDSNTFRVRCLGLFPRSDLDALIPFEVVASAQTRDIVVPPHLEEIWGVDVARFGDDSTVIVKRNSLAVLPEITIWDQQDTMATSNRIHAMYKEAVQRDRAPQEILVDVIGMGAAVVDRLGELGLPVRGVNVSETSMFSETYRNLRTELWFKAREWLESRDHKLPVCDGGCRDRQSCVHERLAGELTTLKYDVTSGGKFLAEPKRDLKKRGHKSPDVADAMVLTFAGEPATLIHGKNDGWGSYAWNQPVSRNIGMV